MASTAYTNNARVTTIGGFSFGFDVRINVDSFSRNDNVVSVNNMTTTVRINSGSAGASFSGFEVLGLGEMPDNTSRYNKSLGSGTFNRGSSYTTSNTDFNVTVDKDATSISCQARVTVNGGTGSGDTESMSIPALGSPSLSSQSSSNIAVTSATITAAASAGSNSSGVASIQLQYGLTTSYGTNSTDSASPFTWDLSGLTPGTTYHYRFVITNNGGKQTTTGDYTFTTLPAPNTSAALLNIVGVL